MVRGYLNIEEGLVIAVIFFTILAIALPVFTPGEDINLILTVSTFLFGIFSGFFISNRWSRYSRIKTLLTNETGVLISVYILSKIIGKEFAKKIANLIDKYLIEAFLYEIYEYHEKTDELFYKFLYTVKDIRPKTIQQKEAISQIIKIMGGTPSGREETYFLEKTKLPKFMYWVIWILAAIIIFCLFYIRTGSITYSFITILLSTSVILVVLVLRDLDNLRWDEKVLAFDIYYRVYDAIGKPRVYPDISIKRGRIKPPKDMDYRLLLIEERNGRQYLKGIKTIKQSRS